MTRTLPALPAERCLAIARMVLGSEAPEEKVIEMAADIGRFAEDFPPLTQEQLEAITVLLRPPPGTTGRPDGP